MYLKTKQAIWESITLFWIRVFALTFALGVASGIPLVFSFGTNWARFSAFVGDVLGSALAVEGFFAFTMEAGALGVLLFGWNKISKKTHFLAVILVSLGAHFSGFWITVVNSWMQTPSGYAIVTNASGTEYFSRVLMQTSRCLSIMQSEENDSNCRASSQQCVSSC